MRLVGKPHAHSRESASKSTNEQLSPWQSFGDVLARIISRLREKLGKS
ncbi:MAG TPA: hypothetical protein VN150_07980 [Ochrobactrum sp.]|nr:hypothetical protein [Ochrobactrum sp.]